MLGELLGAMSTPKFWLNGAILLATVRVLWTVFQRLTEWAIFSLSLRTKTATFTIPAKGERPQEIEALLKMRRWRRWLLI